VAKISLEEWEEFKGLTVNEITERRTRGHEYNGKKIEELIKKAGYRENEVERKVIKINGLLFSGGVSGFYNRKHKELNNEIKDKFNVQKGISYLPVYAKLNKDLLIYHTMMEMTLLITIYRRLKDEYALSGQTGTKVNVYSHGIEIGSDFKRDFKDKYDLGLLDKSTPYRMLMETYGEYKENMNKEVKRVEKMTERLPKKEKNGQLEGQTDFFSKIRH